MKDIKVQVYGKEILIPIPEAAVRIVGFEVEPKSIPRGYACGDGFINNG